MRMDLNPCVNCEEVPMIVIPANCREYFKIICSKKSEKCIVLAGKKENSKDIGELWNKLNSDIV